VEMAFNLRSFAEVLAKMQGGIRLEPGRSYVFEFTEAQVKKIFKDEIPAALAIGNIILTMRKTKTGTHRLVIRIITAT
jgi:hypothetical protein